jgi:hypothetical protein
MLRLVLTAEQSKKLASASGSVEVVDSLGRSIGQLSLSDPVASETQELSAEELAELRRQVNESPLEKGPKYKTHQVRDRA